MLRYVTFLDLAWRSKAFEGKAREPEWIFGWGGGGQKSMAGQARRIRACFPDVYVYVYVCICIAQNYVYVYVYVCKIC